MTVVSASLSKYLFTSFFYIVNIILRVFKSVRRSKTKSTSIVEGTLECLSITAALFGYMATMFSRPVQARNSDEDHDGPRIRDGDIDDKR